LPCLMAALALDRRNLCLVARDITGIGMAARTQEKIQNRPDQWDDEVELASHDRICAWAHENSLEIARAVYPHQFGRDWFPEDIDSTHAWATERERDRFKFDSQRRRAQPRPWPQAKVRWQVPIYGRENRQLGFADLMIDVLMPRIAAEWVTDPHGNCNDVYTRCTINWATEVWVPSILVEVKAQLPTMGDLMRQLNHYRQGFDGALVVITSDDSLSSLLSDQGIRFIRYPERPIR
jgi:hypothetical protein